MPIGMPLTRPTYWTLAEVQVRVGGVPPRRILVVPAAGAATEADLLDSEVTWGPVCELVGGILVAKRHDRRRPPHATRVARHIRAFVAENDAGFVSEQNRPVRLAVGLLRRPDIAFTAHTALGVFAEAIGRGRPAFGVAPDLAVEVLSPGNTPKEMAIKLGEYARAGVRLVWYVDPARSEVTVYPKGKERGKKVLGVDGTLDGGDVLPGFTLPVAKIFEKRSPAKKPGKKKGR